MKFLYLKKISKKISLILNNVNSNDQEKIDKILIELDGSDNKTNLGANATLAVSLANFKCKALLNQKSLYRNFGKKFSLPLPLMNIINGGAHADNELKIQDMIY